MPYKIDSLSVSGPWGESAWAIPGALSAGCAPRYNRLDVVVIGAPHQPRFYRHQQVVLTLQVDGVPRTLFVGRVRGARWVHSVQERALVVSCDGEEMTADLDVCDSPRGAADEITWSAVFNEDGGANKHPDTDTFYFGSTAVRWSFAAAIRKIRDAYLTRATWSLSDAQLLAHTGTRLLATMPTLDVRGMRPLQAIAEILSMAGCRLAFRYQSGACVPVITTEAGHGTFRASYLPVTDQDPGEIGSLQVGWDARQTTPVMYAVSGPAIHETTYSTDDTDPLLAVSGYWYFGAQDTKTLDQSVAYEYAVQVANYGSWGFGALPPGDRMWPLLPNLLTRRTAAGTYVDSATVSSTPEAGETIPVAETLQVLDDSSGLGIWRRIVAGATLELEAADNVVCRLNRQITVLDDAGNQQTLDTTTLNGGEGPGLRFTAAAQLPTARLGIGSSLSDGVLDQDGVINLPKLQPGYRYKSTVPDAELGGWMTLADLAREYYLDIDQAMTDAALGVYNQRGRLASVVEAELPWYAAEVPLLTKLEIANPTGVPLDVTGSEIITEWRWDLDRCIPSITASDALTLQEATLQPAERRQARDSRYYQLLAHTAMRYFRRATA